MIPNETPQTVATVGDGVRTIGNFRITDETQARILVSLSDKMYTRKELAVVREYSNNAADAHIVVGKPISEVQVSLPVLTDLNFRVRDFGTGLTELEIKNVYCVLGESTKRNSAEQNGVLGYGCKAGFAHADSFTVTSWINGEKSIYNCIKGDSTKLHSTILISRCPSTDPSGIEVCVPVSQSSLWTFHHEAADFYKYWDILPNIINMDADHRLSMVTFRQTAPTLKGENWNIRPKSDGTASAVAFMGGVAYRIDWNVLHTRMAIDSQKRVLFDLLQHNDVTLLFKMGEIQFVDSREGLEYTEFTLKALSTRIETIFSKIKESIQEKFDPAPTLWDAKIIYNSIFGIGILEVEKGEDTDSIDRIKVLDGNLLKLENTFNGSFNWKGIPLTDSSFTLINRFDNARPSEIKDGYYNPTDPVMITYRRKKKRVKVNRCSADKNNRIVASNQVAVVLSSFSSKSYQAMVARYLIFKEKSKLRTVHILNFADTTIKDNFYKELTFDTVPVIRLSRILDEARAWVAANKTPRTYGGGSGGARVMKYMDIESESIEENDVAIRDIEDGGIYIEEGEISERRRRHREQTRMVKSAGFEHKDPNDVLQSLKTLVDKTGLDLDRVYIINSKTAEAKWFKQAKESGDWTNVWDYVKENLTVDMKSLVDANAYNSINTVCKKAADMLVPLLTVNKNSPMLNLINIAGNTNYDTNLGIVKALKGVELWHNLKGTIESSIDFTKASNAAEESYPYLNFSHLNNEYYATEEEMKKVAVYVNAMDLYVDWTAEDKPAVKSEEVVSA